MLSPNPPVSAPVMNRKWKIAQKVFFKRLILINHSSFLGHCYDMHTFNGADLPCNKMDLHESVEVIKEATVVIYDTDVDKPVLEDNRNSANHDQLDENGPLQTFIDDFKQKYNILVEPNEIAIFV